jgi:hypothetical protein
VYLVGVIKEAFDNYQVKCTGDEHIGLLSLSWNNRISLQIIARFYLTSHSVIWDSDGATCVYGKYHRTICSVVTYFVITLPLTPTEQLAGPTCSRLSRVYYNSLNGLTTALFWVVTQQAVTQKSTVHIYFAVEVWNHAALNVWFQTLRLYKVTYWQTLTCSDDEWSENQNSGMCAQIHRYIFNWINQPDAATSQVYYLSFKYSSTCFGHTHAHHQELQLQ